METPGFEPGASYMRSKRSTAELRPHEDGLKAPSTSCNWLVRVVTVKSDAFFEQSIATCTQNLVAVQSQHLSLLKASGILLAGMRKDFVRSGIRTHAWRTRLRPERSALDRSAILTTQDQTCLMFPIF